MKSLSAFFLTCILLSLKLTDGGRILVIVSTASFSHQIAFREVWKALSQRGHEVVSITTNPLRDKTLTNLTEIDISRLYKFLENVDFTLFKSNSTWLEIMESHLYDFAKVTAEIIFEDPQMRKLYATDSQEKFDVVIVETVLTPALYAMADRFKAPLIGVISLGITADLHYSCGSSVLPSHPSTWDMESRAGYNLPLWRKVKNYLLLNWFLYRKQRYFISSQQQIAQKYLGKDITPLRELERDMSLVFVMQPEYISANRPHVPKVIRFGGMHVAKNPQPLPKDLKKFLDDAKEGFVYVSLGTNAAINPLSQNIKDAFMRVLTNLPYKVVIKLKLKATNITGNMYMSKWFPQQSILAHPNIKLFVYQGGLQSTEEAVHWGVPFVGLPILADQYYQVLTLERIGVAKLLDILQLDEETFRNAIMEVITNPSYKENAMKIRNIALDRPYDYVEHAIWWIEHVIRHKGASYMQSSIAYEPWYERDNLDVVATLSIVTFLIILSILYVSYKLFTVIARYFHCTLKENEQKEKVS